MLPRLFLTAGVAAAAAVIAAACSPTTSGSNPYGSANPPSSTAPSAAPVAVPSPSPEPPAATGTEINVGSTKVGQVLVDSNGLTVYLFLADKGSVSSCNSASCMQYWPPVLTTGTPRAGSGVTATLLGTIARADGSMQVTYAGHPLYRFINDKSAGETTGQGVNAFGAPWYVVSPSGTQIG